ncbi:nucleotide exchange factor GrpE [Methanolobus sp. ZRKC3]|uniref:nucleotide exchange factor GrpE n=1 Tax=Methanolobus sp. ZRKC3 TaxID=3125786 RepID=UPI0032477F83
MAKESKKCDDLETVEDAQAAESPAEDEAAQLRDKLLRLTAEFDNYRKRSIREKEEYRKFAVEQLIVELLEVHDNFERALDSAKQADETQAVIKGVEMVFKQFAAILEKEGLQKIECKGAEFDPHLHDAMLHIENPDNDDNTVMDVCKPGYYLHSKVIRPAMVTVSKKPEE